MILIQESHLKPGLSEPSIPGYGKPFRSDRANKDRGGLIIYLKDSLIFRKVREENKSGTELQTISIKLAGSRWVNLTNVYCPPDTSLAFANETLRLETDNIPVDSDSIIAGDFNARSILWDEIQPPDQRGTDVEDWVVDKDLSMMAHQLG